MKLPPNPPGIEKLVAAGQDSIGQLLAKIAQLDLLKPDVAGEYLAWDELRHRPPPTGLSAEEWWNALRFMRAPLWKNLPMTDLAGRPFHFAMTDAVSRLVHEIDQDASGRIELPELVATPHTRDRYLVSSLVEEAITSSQLEGAATTRRVAKEMLLTARRPKNLSERMILNNYRAMERVRALKEQALSVEMLRELHSILATRKLTAVHFSSAPD